MVSVSEVRSHPQDCDAERYRDQVNRDVISRYMSLYAICRHMSLYVAICRYMSLYVAICRYMSL